MPKDMKQKPNFTQPITKLIMPSIPPSYLKRPRLNKLYQKVIKRKILLVTAPAGYGKTSFLSEALAQIEHPVAWISLDCRDDHIIDFWNNIIMAIQMIEPSFGAQLLINLQKNEESIETVLTEMINEIIKILPDLYIVLDDHQYIESKDIHASIEFLMDYLPPRAHLLISSRISPPLSLNRLRGRGYVSEIKTNDLKFTIEETAELLNDVMAFSLNKTMIRHVYSRMEGWIAGLQMVVLTIQEKADVNALFAAFKGSDNDVLEYLTNEVLNQQEERLREFLLETSILDHFNGRMCDYIFERNDSCELLDILISKNLFLQSIDHEGSWFRYHSIFRSALQKGLNRQQDDILAWHKRASYWFENEGLTEDAIDHALEAGDYNRAVSLLEKIVMFIMGQDKYVQLWAWIKKLPNELVGKSMWANIGCAVACENTRQPEQQQLFTQGALSISETMAAFAYRDTPYYAHLLGSLYTLRMLDAYHKGDITLAIKHADDGLAAMPENENRGRCGLLCVKGFALWKNGELRASYRCSEEAALLSKVVGWTYAVFLSLSSIAHIRFALGHLNSAAETCRQIQNGCLLEEQEISSGCYACLLLAQIHYQWNSLDEAEKQILNAIKQSENGQEPVLCLSSQMALARIYIVRDKVDAAIEIAQHAKLIYENEFPDSVLADIFMTRLWIMLGDYSAAEDCSESWTELLFPRDVDLNLEETIYSLPYKGIYDNDIRNIWAEVPLFTYIRVKLARDKVEGLEQLLAGVRQDVESKQWKSLAIETMILEALVFNAGGNSEAAMEVLKDALILAENENYLRLFADEGQPMLQLLKKAKRKGNYGGFIAKIISLINQPADKKNHNMSASLTKREIEILELICDGAANKEIAERLYISLPTVKNHIYNIYGKLDINNRAQAVVRAQEMGLLKFD